MFTTPCFIRKNTPELRARLEELGYKKHPDYIMGKSDSVLYCNNLREFYSNRPMGYTEEINNTIDCSENEDLFLALAVIRDDSDYMQWIICLKEYHKGASIVEVGDFKLWKNKAAFKESHYWRKATVEELIKHFNK